MPKEITTQANAEAYEATDGVFLALISEVRELSKKKPEAVLTAAKVKIVNRVLGDLLAFLQDEPEGKYLELLAADDLPQVSDALLQMTAFGAALNAFKSRYTLVYCGEERWVTPEGIAELEAEGAFDNDDDSDDDDDDDDDSDDDDDDDDDDDWDDDEDEDHPDGSDEGDDVVTENDDEHDKAGRRRQ